MSKYTAIHQDLVTEKEIEFPEVSILVPGSNSALRKRRYLSGETQVTIVSPPTSQQSAEALYEVASTADGFTWRGLWGDIQAALYRPQPQYLPPKSFTVIVAGEAKWEDHPFSIRDYILGLRSKISKRNRQIADLRRDFSQAKQDKEFWKSVAKDYEKTVSSQS